MDEIIDELYYKSLELIPVEVFGAPLLVWIIVLILGVIFGLAVLIPIWKKITQIPEADFQQYNQPRQNQNEEDDSEDNSDDENSDEEDEEEDSDDDDDSDKKDESTSSWHPYKDEVVVIEDQKFPVKFTVTKIDEGFIYGIITVTLPPGSGCLDIHRQTNDDDYEMCELGFWIVYKIGTAVKTATWDFTGKNNNFTYRGETLYIDEIEAEISPLIPTP